MPSRYGHTLSDSRLDFENLTQSEAREPSTSGWESVMEGHAMVLIVSIALSHFKAYRQQFSQNFAKFIKKLTVMT